MHERGRVAIVTGGSRGIGAEIAVELARHGLNVAVVYKQREQNASSVVEKLLSYGVSGCAFRCDIADESSVQVCVSAIAEQYHRVDAVVNCAGITRDRTFRKMSIEEWDSVIDTNLRGTMLMTRYALPHVIDAGSGSIVNVASFIAQTGNIGQTNYSASKAGIIGFTRSLALEVARYNITVNAICPGFIDTEMLADMPADVRQSLTSRIPLGRLGAPSDVAEMTRFLILEGSYVTGQTINVNGGIYLE